MFESDFIKLLHIFLQKLDVLVKAKIFKNSLFLKKKKNGAILGHLVIITSTMIYRRTDLSFFFLQVSNAFFAFVAFSGWSFDISISN